MSVAVPKLGLLLLALSGARPSEIAYFNVPNTQVPGLSRIRVAERELWFATTTTFFVLSLPEAVVGPILGG